MAEPFKPTRKRTIHDLRLVHRRGDVLAILERAYPAALYFEEIAQRLGAIERKRFDVAEASFGAGNTKAMTLHAVSALLNLAREEERLVERVWIDLKTHREVQMLTSRAAAWPKNHVDIRIPGHRPKRVHEKYVQGRWRRRYKPEVFGWDLGRDETSVTWSMVDGAVRIDAVAVRHG